MCFHLSSLPISEQHGKFGSNLTDFSHIPNQIHDDFHIDFCQSPICLSCLFYASHRKKIKKRMFYKIQKKKEQTKHKYCCQKLFLKGTFETKTSKKMVPCVF